MITYQIIMSYACHYPGARMSVSDGTLTIVAKNQAVMEKVLEKVNLTFNRSITFRIWIENVGLFLVSSVCVFLSRF